MRRGIKAVAAACLLAGAVPAAEPLKVDQLDEVAALVKPGPREDAWASIPWMTSLWEARQRAAKEGKPILLWEMDGNPLACT